MSVQPKDHRCPCGVYDEHCPHCVHRDELIEDMKQAECGKCGRSLAPDGDCFGCEADRLTAENAALLEVFRAGKAIIDYSEEGERYDWPDWDEKFDALRSAIDAVRNKD